MLSSQWDTFSHDDLLEEKRILHRRLDDIGVRDAPRRLTKTKTTRVDGVPYTPKVDAHWDFVMKEMMWLGADFQGERKRQLSLAKKCASSVKQYHKTKETRRLKELHSAGAQRRRNGAKIGRDVKNWWSKIERVISYKQKLEADEQRERAMNKQLVLLVQQTERYSAALSGNKDMTVLVSGGDLKRHNDIVNRKKTNLQKRITIEAALAMERKRKSKEKVRDYAKMKLEDAEFYGESTLPDAASDVSYVPESDTDDESTIKAAMDDELRSRMYMQNSSARVTYSADPFELRRLQEEADMDISKVIARLRAEGESQVSFEQERPNDCEKQVRFKQNEDRRTEKEDQASALCNVTHQLSSAYSATNDANLEVDGEMVNNSTDDNTKVDNASEVVGEEGLLPDASPGHEIAFAKESKSSIEDVPTFEESSMNEDPQENNSDIVDDRPLKGESTSMKAEESPSQQKEIDRVLPSGTPESNHHTPGTAEAAGLRSPIHSKLNGLCSVTSDLENEEYQPNDDDGVDDETTISAEERLGRDMSYEDELALLKRENEMSIEELRAMYAAHSTARETEDEENSAEEVPIGVSSGADASRENEEYQPNDEDGEDGVDDETTISAEERLGRDMSYEDELAFLKRENEMSIEELRAMYTARYRSNQAGDKEGQSFTDSDRTTSDHSFLAGKPSSTSFNGRIRSGKIEFGHTEGSTAEDGEKALHTLEASSALARTTLASRPFLLACWVKLRKYQQVGLNWLVSLQSRSLNGILADEMGLGKTLQTISLLSYLASYKGIWGPHLIVVPTSVIINWETELKRFCPALKVLCYYGSAKRRKELRTGWTQTNWYHVVITSYQLAVQDAFAFKRKKWYYLILDEAQNIKNFQSQRWQTLINFNSRRRLLLTGTPLQNSLMELWSLLHFLMPYIFRSRKEFSYWFSNPMNSIIEGKTNRDDEIIKKLHGIIRPFVLRRLKKDVETQMPGKFEHIVKCQLSRRQMQLYEEFLSRSSTRQALKSGGNFMGMMNVLMQLRKVCNHPDLFEPRSIMTPFVVPGLRISVPGSLCCLVPWHVTSSSISESILKPLWSRRCSIRTPKTVVKICGQDLFQSHPKNNIGEKQSPSLSTDCSNECPDELRALLDEIVSARREEHTSRVKFQKAVNCRRSIPYPYTCATSLIDAVDIEVDIFHRLSPVEVRNRGVLSTPTDLLRLRSLERQRANQLEDSIDKFVMCVPKVGASAPTVETIGSLPFDFSSRYQKRTEALLEGPLEAASQPYRKAHARLSAFFPDKKLVQYDAGKLQKLADLLRDLKQGGHRALIFTQMSKMLDILEAFLNINGHTYLRLDGSTGIDRRQRFMDRFNNDEKIFCFILSTRSGGMGINLTGADSVIFYDSDWNPAMDAQAQDRAHRIGQTREVHIYRLVTEHTIEENILIKAKQKRNLDMMVMDQGKFDASSLCGEVGNQVKDVYSNRGLRDILGVNTDECPHSHDNGNVSNEQMEKAMASLEDDDDVQALKGARLEAAEELREFDEAIDLKEEVENGGEAFYDHMDSSSIPPSKRRKLQNQATDKDPEEQKSSNLELERDFATWRSTVGLDAAAINGALAPMERYALNFREAVDPFYSTFHKSEESRIIEVEQLQEDVNIEEIERLNSFEEKHAIDVGDLLGTRPRPESLIRQRNLYQRERMRLSSEKKRRQLTGKSWSTKIDGLTKTSFWYNSDTGEAMWNKPAVLTQIEEFDVALKKGWGYLPLETLVGVMGFLVPFRDRQMSASVCQQWKIAANDVRFIRHVYPVEMGAISRETKRLHNHYGSLDEVLAVAMPGDTIELSDGHYWVSGQGLAIEKPLKFVGDENNPSNVVIEISGSLEWKAMGGRMEGITFRRPKISASSVAPSPILKVTGIGRVDLGNCVFENNMYEESVTKLSGTGSKGCWSGILIRNGGWHGIEMEGSISLLLKKSYIVANGENGIKCSSQSMLSVYETRVQKNHGFALEFQSGAKGNISKCVFDMNKKGIIRKEQGCSLASSGNTAYVVELPEKSIPGFTFKIL